MAISGKIEDGVGWAVHEEGVKASSRLRTACLVLAASLLAAGMCWFIYSVFVPVQIAEWQRVGLPRGNASDLYPPWYAGREFLLHGRDPYSQQVTAEIQRGVYGRQNDTSGQARHVDEARFAYPVYISFVLAPTFGFGFATAEKLFQILFLALGVFSCWAWWRALRFQFSVVSLLAGTILYVGSWAFLEGVRLAQLTLLVVPMLAGATVAYTSSRFSLAGLLLGLAMIKPQFALPLSAWFILVSFGRARDRLRFIIVWFSTVLILLGSSELLYPGWMKHWTGATAAYAKYQTTTATAFSFVLGEKAAMLPAFGIGITVAYFILRNRNCELGSESFRVLTASVLTCTVVLSPFFHYTDHVLFFPLVALIVESWIVEQYSFELRVLFGVVLGVTISTWMLALYSGAVALFREPESMLVMPLKMSVMLWPYAMTCGMLGLLFASRRCQNKLQHLR